MSSIILQKLQVTDEFHQFSTDYDICDINFFLSVYLKDD